MKFPAERSLSYSFYPLYLRKGKRKGLVKLPHVVKSNRCGEFDFVSSSFWGPIEFAFMDMLAAKVLDMHNTNGMTNLYKVSAVKEAIEKPTSHINFVFTEDELRKCHPSFASLNSIHILNLIDKIANYKVKLKYKVRAEIDDKMSWYVFDNTKLDDNMVSLFTYQVKPIMTSNTGVIYKRKYKISFDTSLGNLFCINVASINLDWINHDFYNLSDYTQLIYRMLINSTRSYTINTSAGIISKKIHFLGLNKYQVEDTIVKSFNELVSYGYLKDWVCINPDVRVDFKHFMLSKRKSLKHIKPYHPGRKTSKYGLKN